MLLKVFAHGVQDLDEQGIAQGIKHLISVLACHDQMALPQNTEVLGKVRRFHIHLFPNGADGKFARAQGLDDVNASGVGKDLENARLELAQGLKVFWIKR